jgi:glutamine amidotransferase-like uncharacterized protein
MKPTIALFVADPFCSVQSANGIINALGNDYTFKLFSKNEVEDGFFDSVDIVAVPGGFGDANSFTRLFKANQNSVKTFVTNGGKYLGICMGAYWAGSYYLDLLDSINAVQYITQPNTDTRRPHAKDINIVWQGHPNRMFFYDGCALVGDANKFNTIATYANGDAMAIIQNNIGLIGCHPEAEQFWYDSYSWMRGKYHKQHHQLLLDFVNQLNTGCSKEY